MKPPWAPMGPLGSLGPHPAGQNETARLARPKGERILRKNSVPRKKAARLAGQKEKRTFEKRKNELTSKCLEIQKSVHATFFLANLTIFFLARSVTKI